MDLIVDNGKVEEPTRFKKAVAAVTLDTDAVLVLPFGDVHQFVVDRLWTGCEWLKKYKTAGMRYNQADNSFTITFHVAPKINHAEIEKP